MAEGQRLAAFVGDICPVGGSDAVLGEELGTHAYAEGACGEPCVEIVGSGLYASGYHQLAPGHGCEQSFYKFRPENVAGEYLA